MAENILKVEFCLSNIKEKGKPRDKIMTEIKKYVCALLNTNGGKLVLTASDATADNKIDADIDIRGIEPYFENIIGSFELYHRFHIMEKRYNAMTFDIQALPILCTLNTYLFMPANSQMMLISGKDQDALRHILFERRIVENLEHKVAEKFSYGCHCGFHESKTVQFKLLKTEKTKQTNFADRVINRKFTNIISGFANADGGNIFYGINDNGIVEGELLSDLELQKTTEKLEKAVGTMIWRDESRKVERGREWDIKFVPVKNCNNETIPSTFVMVVTVHPYIGGVFTKEPVSYYVEDGEVKKMSFDIWRRNTYYKVANSMQELERSSWSSENRKRYMKITHKLENLRQIGNWKQIKSIVKEISRRDNLSVNTQLTCLIQIIAVCYHQGNFTDAVRFLEQFRDNMDSAEDKLVFAVVERYSTSAIERSRGNYQEAWKIIDDGLKLAHHAPAGFIPAAVYVNAASVFSSLVHDEFLVDTSKDEKYFKGKTHQFLEMAKSLCHHAMQHSLYIEDEFEIARENLKQRIEITLASLHLRLADRNHSSISSSDQEIATAMILIDESEQSLMKLRGTTRLMCNSCRLLLVKSDLYFRMFKSEPTDKRTEYLKQSLKYVDEARELAVDKGFHEIKRLCEERSQKMKDEEHSLKIKNQVENDKMETTMDELLDNN